MGEGICKTYNRKRTQIHNINIERIKIIEEKPDNPTGESLAQAGDVNMLRAEKNWILCIGIQWGEESECITHL